MSGADAVVARIGGDEFGVVLSANCDGSNRSAPARSSQVRARLLNRRSRKAGIRICERRRCGISG